MMNLKKSELKDILDFSIDTALRAGELLTKYQKNLAKLKIDFKEAQGVVSKADRDSEALVIKAIKKHFKGDEILAEESSFLLHGGKREAYEYYKGVPRSWMIDPLDGTSNYLNGLDYYCVSIAFCIYGEPVVGVIYRPSNGELFYSIKGEGAHHLPIMKKQKREKLSLTKNKKSLKTSMLVTGFSSEKGVAFHEEFLDFQRIMHSSRAVRRFGSAALDLCYVANGIMDGFWERSLAPWDVAAGGLIALESKVKVSDYNGQPFTPFQETIIAAREPLFLEFRQKLINRE